MRLLRNNATLGTEMSRSVRHISLCPKSYLGKYGGQCEVAFRNKSSPALKCAAPLVVFMWFAVISASCREIAQVWGEHLCWSPDVVGSALVRKKVAARFTRMFAWDLIEHLASCLELGVVM